MEEEKNIQVEELVTTNENTINKDNEVVENKEEMKQRKERLFKMDMESLKGEFDLEGIESIRDIPNYRNFAILRGNGLSVKDAFLGANPSYLLSKSYNGDYSHIDKKSIGVKGNSLIPIPEKERKLWQSAFPQDDLDQLTKRYNKAIDC